MKRRDPIKKWVKHHTVNAGVGVRGRGEIRTLLNGHQDFKVRGKRFLERQGKAWPVNRTERMK